MAKYWLKKKKNFEWTYKILNLLHKRSYLKEIL